jgi:imidazolonepropionase-like amidohydrolase
VTSLLQAAHADLSGEGYIVPGFIDVHSHWVGMFSAHPAQSWEMEAFIAYGVTTLHK